MALAEGETALDEEQPATVWAEFLVRDFERSKAQWRSPHRDCSGRAVEVEASCGALEPPPQPLPPRALKPEDVVVTPIDERHQLVWVQVRHFADGQAVGPVAVVERGNRSLSVRALGMLRGASKHATLRIEKTAAAEVLVAEGQACATDAASAGCRELVSLMPKKAGVFRNVPLEDENGQCLGPAQFELQRTRVVDLGGGSQRRFELFRTLRVQAGEAVVEEQVVVQDSDGRDPDATPEVFRRASLTRPLAFAEDRVVTSEGLWQAMVTELGSVAIGG